MGAIRAIEMIEHAGVEAALADHLQFNHYPAVSLRWLPLVKRAIELAAADEWDEPVRVEGEPPPEVHGKSVYDFVDGLHLDPFVVAAREVSE